MKVWTLTYNDDNSSPSCDVFTSREAMEQAKEEWVQGYQYDYPDVDFDQPADDILQDLYNKTFFMDSVTEQEHVLTPQRKGLRRFYVTATWDNWPEGGSYGDIVWATCYTDAENQLLAMMVDSRGDDDYQSQWHIVDCFPLDDFIQSSVDFRK